MWRTMCCLQLIHLQIWSESVTWSVAQTPVHWLTTFQVKEQSKGPQNEVVGTENEWMNEFNSSRGRWARHSATDCARCFTQAAALSVNMHVIYAGVIAEIERFGFFSMNESAHQPQCTSRSCVTHSIWKKQKQVHHLSHKTALPLSITTTRDASKKINK